MKGARSTSRRNPALWTALSGLLLAVAGFATPVSVADDPLPSGYHGLVRMLVEARGRNVSRAEKAEVLRIASEQYKQLLQKRTGLDEAGLLKKFQNDDAFRNGLLSFEDPYRTLYSEINYLASSLISDGVFDRCNKQFDPKWLQEQAITRNVLEQRSKYEASCEGAGYRGQITILSRRSNDGSANKEAYAAYPLIFSGKNAAALLELSDHIEMESSLKEAPTILGKKFPAYRAVGTDPKKNSAAQDAYLEVKRTEQLKGEIYAHAMINSYRTKASIDYFFGGQSLAEVERSLRADADYRCVSCSPSEKSAVVKRALNGVLSDQKADPKGHTKFRDPRSLVVRMCNRLIDAGYFDYYGKNVELKFEDGKFVQGKKRRDRLAEPAPGDQYSPTPKVLRPEVIAEMERAKRPDQDNLQASSIDLVSYVSPMASPVRKPSPPVLRLDPGALTGFGEAGKYANVRDPKLSPMSGAAMDAEYDFRLYGKRRMAIYQSVVKEGFTNLLFMTDALSGRNVGAEGTEYTPKLNCTQDSLNADAEKVEAAMAEAKRKTGEVMDDLNETIKPVDPGNPKAAESNRRQIEKMIRKNPTAVGQAIAERPTLAPLVCDGLNRTILSDLKEKDRHTAFLWGVNIVGTGLLFTGVGSGVGLEMLIAGGLLATSTTLTVDQHVRSEDAKELAELMRTQYRGGQNDNGYLLEVSEENVREYQSLKIGMMDVFGVSVDSLGVIGTGLKASITLAGMNRMVTAAKGSKSLRELALEKGPVQFFADLAKPLDATENARITKLNWDPLEYAERKWIAEDVLGVKIGSLSADQADAVYRAHLVGAGNSGYGTYTRTELARKWRILDEAGFRNNEIQGILRNGVAGADHQLASVEDQISKLMASARLSYPSDPRQVTAWRSELWAKIEKEIERKFPKADPKSVTRGITTNVEKTAVQARRNASQTAANPDLDRGMVYSAALRSGQSGSVGKKFEITAATAKALERAPASVAEKLGSWMAKVEKEGLLEVRKIPGYRDEPLSEFGPGVRSIRLNQGVRATYRMKDGKIEILDVGKQVYAH